MSPSVPVLKKYYTAGGLPCLYGEMVRCCHELINLTNHLLDTLVATNICKSLLVDCRA